MADLVTTIGLSDEQFNRTLDKLEGRVRTSTGRMARDASNAGRAASDTFGRQLGTFRGQSTILGAARGAIGALGVGVAGVGMIRSASMAVREYAQTNDYLESRIAKASLAQDRFSHSLGRDLALATGEASGGIETLVDGFSRLREEASNSLGDIIRSVVTLSNEFGNATAAAEALAKMESQDRMFAGLLKSQTADRAFGITMAGISGDRFGAETQSARLEFRNSRQTIEADRESERRTVEHARSGVQNSIDDMGRYQVNASLFMGPFAGMTALAGYATRAVSSLYERDFTETETSELISIDSRADRRLAQSGAVRDARIGNARRDRDERSRIAMELPDRLNSARMSGSQDDVRAIEREIELERIRASSHATARGLGASDRDAERFAGESAEARRAEFFRQDRDEAKEERARAESARRVVGERQTELEISARLAAGDREGALALRERAEIARLTHSIAAESALSEHERTRAIEMGTASIRDRYSAERQTIADDRAGRYAAAGSRSTDLIDSLRAQALSASGDDAGAAAIRQRMEIRDLERRIVEDELLSEDRRNALIREGTRLIEERFGFESRTMSGTGASGFADIPVGFGGDTASGRDRGASVLERRKADRERLRGQLIEDSETAVDMRGQPRGPSVTINGAAAHRARLEAQGGGAASAPTQSVQVAGVGEMVGLLGDILEKVESVIR